MQIEICHARVMASIERATQPLYLQRRHLTPCAELRHLILLPEASPSADSKVSS
jgi:hypothetical protein